MFKPINRIRQKRIQLLAKALKEAEVGELVTHAAIENIVGISPCPNTIFQTAHKLANRESGCYFDSVRGEGYIRRPAVDWDGVAIKYRTRVRRQGSTGRKFITNIVNKSNELSDEEQRRASREIGLLSTIESMTRRIGGQK